MSSALNVGGGGRSKGSQLTGDIATAQNNAHTPFTLPTLISFKTPPPLRLSLAIKCKSLSHDHSADG